MFNKTLLYLFLFFIIIQIGFSFYYSSEIVSQNQILNENITLAEKLKKENRYLEQKLSLHYSIDKIFQFTKEKNYKLIKKEIICE